MTPALDLFAYQRASREAFSSLVRNRRLIYALVRRELFEPYSGQMLGGFWTIAHPLFLVVLYAVVFTVVFQTRIGGTRDMPLDYTVYILSGLVPWMTFQQAMSKGCAAITGHAEMVNQVIFPVEILPVKSALSCLSVLFVGGAFILIYTIFSQRVVYWIYAMIPVALFMQALTMIGVAYFLSSISVFFRDAKDFVQLFSVANIFFMPAIYLPQWIPEHFRLIIKINPFSYLVWMYQDIFYFGRFEHPAAWIIMAIGSLLSFGAGYRVFRRLRHHFGGVL